MPIQWKYCKDELPKKDGHYVVATHNVRLGMTNVSRRKFKNGDWFHNKWYDKNPVYAWAEKSEWSAPELPGEKASLL